MQQVNMAVNNRTGHLATLMLSFVIAACAGTGVSVATPDVTLNSVEMSSVSFSGQTFQLRFDVNNPNPFPLPIKSIRYHLQLADKTFASGETQGDFSVPASGSGAFDISVEIDILKSAGQLTGILRSGMREPLAYKLSGSLAVDIPFVKPLPFSTSGVITIASR